jgi:hypothetical protein
MERQVNPGKLTTSYHLFAVIRIVQLESAGQEAGRRRSANLVLNQCKPVQIECTSVPLRENRSIRRRVTVHEIMHNFLQRFLEIVEILAAANAEFFGDFFDRQPIDVSQV